MMGYRNDLKKGKKEYFSVKVENCQKCVNFDGKKMCGKYTMITAPDKWCKSFKELKK